MKGFLTGLLQQLDNQRTKSNSIIDDLLNNKSAVAEAQAQADLAVSLATRSEERVASLVIDHRKLDDKLERPKKVERCNYPWHSSSWQ